VDFALFAEDTRCFHHFTFRDIDSNELLQPDGLLHLCYIELHKEPSLRLRYWVDFFNDKPCADDAPDYIKQAYELVDFVNMSAREQKMITAAELGEQDHIGQMRWAKKVAMAEGVAKGEAKAKAELVAAMASRGLSAQQISDLAGLSTDEVERLLSVVELSL
jgi:hypothetical protein